MMNLDDARRFAFYYCIERSCGPRTSPAMATCIASKPALTITTFDKNSRKLIGTDSKRFLKDHRTHVRNKMRVDFELCGLLLKYKK